jgi:hypothetical protein
MALTPMAASDRRPGSMRTTSVPADRSRLTSRSRRLCEDQRMGASGVRARPWAADIGETTTTTSSPEPDRTSAFVGECTPPSKYDTPSMRTGAK